MTALATFESLVGTWEGGSLRARAALDGRMFEVDTLGTFGRYLLDGHALVGCRVDDQDLDACAGEHDGGKLVVRGKGWRTTFRLADDVLEIEAIKRGPDGTEDRALTTLRRVSA